MESIKQYLLSLIATAMICGIVQGFFSKKSTYGTLIQLLSGIVMLYVLLSPLKSVTVPDLSIFTDSLTEQARRYAADGVEEANLTKADIIKTQTEAYILDKAASMEADICVDVIMSTQPDSTPVAVIIQGTVSPYTKSVLECEIEGSLGIPKEQQQWN